MDWIVVNGLGVALAIGLIIGAERGWQNQQEDTDASAAGVRSFGFVGLLGGLAMLLALSSSESLSIAMPIVLAALFFGFSLTVAVSYWLTAQATKDFGMTTEIALLLTFCLGALAVNGYKAESIAVAVVVTVILGLKQEMHRSLSKLNRAELQATLQLLLLGIVALPLLPNQALGPWDAINPRTIGWLVVLIAATSYTGYFAVRLLGERTGLMLTALLGAVVSSTAVTVSFAQMYKKKMGSPMLLGAGISLAAGTMAVRLLIEISVVNAQLLRWLVPPIAGLALVPLIAAVMTHLYLSRAAIDPRTSHRSSYRSSHRSSHRSNYHYSSHSEQLRSSVKLKNPLELKSALFYGGAFTLLFVLVQAAQSWLGDSGIYLLSGLSGITDVDAVSLSLAASAKSVLSERVAVLGILLAVTVNTLVKAGLAIAIGGWPLARWSTSILLTSLGISGLTLWVVSGLPSA